MFVMLERQRYFREHVFITVLDAATGVQIYEFQYRAWVITQNSGVTPDWSNWTEYKGDSAFPFKLPAFCKLHVEIKGIGFPQRYRVEKVSLLVFPTSSHQMSVRIAKSFRQTGLIVDDDTNEWNY